MLPEKILGKRKPRQVRTTEEIRDFLNLVIYLSKGKTHIRKGIYRFKTFEEEDEFFKKANK